MLVLLILLLISVSPATLVQGFYWQQQLQYTHSQRLSLIKLLPPGSTFIHMPQILDSLAPWNSSDIESWRRTATYCLQHRIDLVFGLRTMYIDDLNATLARIEDRLKQFQQPFILGWDDCPGGLTDSQKKLQLQILEKISRKPWAIIPAAYYSSKGSISKWVIDLSIISNADLSIPFILTSKNGINPATMNPETDFPPLKRKMIFWDNWMAVDSLTRFPRNLPRSRSIKLFDQKSAYGYMLNLCFPPERIVHGIASIRYQQQGLEYDYRQIAALWSQYLLQNEFISAAESAQMQQVLWELIYYSDGTMEVKELLKKYPILSTFLYD